MSEALKGVWSLCCCHQKLMTLMNPKNGEEEEEDISQMQTDVTDEEMALR